MDHSDPRPRGRPRKDEPRDQVVKVSFTVEEFTWVSQRAAVNDLSLADYCRRKVLNRAVPAGDEGGPQSSTFFEPVPRPNTGG